MKVAGGCLPGSGNNGKVCIWFRKIKGKQPNLLTMTLGYRSIVSLDAATSRLERAFFSRRIFFGKNLEERQLNGRGGGWGMGRDKGPK